MTKKKNYSGKKAAAVCTQKNSKKVTQLFIKLIGEEKMLTASYLQYVLVILLWKLRHSDAGATTIY